VRSWRDERCRLRCLGGSSADEVPRWRAATGSSSTRKIYRDVSLAREDGTMRTLITASAIAAAFAAGCGGDDDDGGTRTGTTAPEDRGIEDVVENPEGVQERTEERYAEFVECRLADEVPDDECTPPGEMP
jgi:hypothetical protein